LESAGISSVVPSKTLALTERIEKISGVHPYIIDRSFPFGFTLNYETPETLGIDRICSAEGALHTIQSESPRFTGRKNNYIIIIDFGTATTLNILRMPGEFLGGMILPGIETMINSLYKNAAQLPTASEKEYKHFIGSNTLSSIASGVINSNAGLIHMVRDHLKKKGAGEIKIFVTGGNAEKIIPIFDFQFKFEKALVLIGINEVCRKMKG
jgi:type III pantothenate kinase